MSMGERRVAYKTVSINASLNGSSKEKEKENDKTSKHREVQELKEKNADLLFQMATQEQAMRKMQRGFEIVYCLLPKVRITETKIVETVKMCPDITFSPKKYITYPEERILANKTLGELQPMKLGLMRLSMRA